MLQIFFFTCDTMSGNLSASSLTASNESMALETVGRLHANISTGSTSDLSRGIEATWPPGINF